jgi:transcriptional regulator with XRE-family HTH domain
MVALTFGATIAAARKRQKLSISAMARAAGVSVVYYREVELGSRKPFSSLRIDFDILAGLLREDAAKLQTLAAGERGQLEFSFHGTRRDERRVLILLGRCLFKKRFTKAQLRRLETLLREAS